MDEDTNFSVVLGRYRKRVKGLDVAVRAFWYHLVDLFEV
jgi:hypothetical protein